MRRVFHVQRIGMVNSLVFDITVIVLLVGLSESLDVFYIFVFFLILTFLFDFGLSLFYQPAAMRKGILNNDLNIQRITRIIQISVVCDAVQSAYINLFKSFIYKRNSNNAASNTQEHSQKLKIDMIKYFTIILFLSAKPLEWCWKFWKHISQTVFIIIFSTFVWANIYRSSLKIQAQFFMCTYYLI